MSQLPSSWVVDASAMMPVIDNEPCSERAQEWFAGVSGRMGESATVDLFDAECANALWKRVRREHWPMAVAERALSRVLDLPLRRIPLSDFVEDALRLAVGLGLSVYDACYVALAMASDLPLVTADRRLAKAAREAGCEVVCFTEDS